MLVWNDWADDDGNVYDTSGVYHYDQDGDCYYKGDGIGETKNAKECEVICQKHFNHRSQ